MTGTTDSASTRVPRHSGQVSYASLLYFYLFLLAISATLNWAGLTEKPDFLIHDIWVKIGRAQPAEDIAIVGIDSRSLQETGRWPWSREIQARLVESITDAGAQSIVFDILLTEPDRDSVADDLQLAGAISRHGQVVLPILTGEYSAGKRNPEALPIAEMTLAVAGLGHVFMPVDPDGIVRRVNLKSGFKSAHWSTLSLALAELLEQAPDPLPGALRDARPQIYAWVSDHEVFIPFYGQGGTFTTYSASQVLSGAVGPDALAGKHVFVGVTAVGLGDILPTPVSNNAHPMSGVEVHATLFAALRDGRLVSAAHPYTGIVVIAVSLVLLLFFLVRSSPGLSLSASFVFALVPVVVSFVLYSQYRLWYPPLSAALPLLLSFPIWSWNRLEFVSRFIEGEINEADTEFEPVTTSQSLSLTNYLDTAMSHLPISGWRYVSNGQVFSNGQVNCSDFTGSPERGWTVRGECYYKAFATLDQLHVCIAISEPELADEITHMIESLSRIKDRELIESRRDTAERLQLKAKQLSARMAHLRRINTVSESIFHGSPAGLVVWNIAGEFVRMNELAYSMLPQILGPEPAFKVFLSALDREPDREDAGLFRALLIDKAPWQLECDLAGVELVMDFSVVGERFADRLLVASIVDVSKIRESERARAELMEYLSHDLRSPLISTVYMLENQRELLRGIDSSSLDKVERNINRSLGLIDDLLNLARADNLKQEELAPVLFDNVVSNSVDQLSPLAQEKHIVLRIEQDENEDLWVNGNAILLERALINVIGNAIKYSPGETVILVRTLGEARRLCCQVDDEGIGVSEDQILTMFDRFKRSESVERQYQGSGLGLALVSRVVAQHHGHVSAQNLRRGLRVSIELPRLELEDD